MLRVHGRFGFHAAPAAAQATAGSRSRFRRLPAFHPAGAQAHRPAQRHGHLPARRPRTAADRWHRPHSRRLALTNPQTRPAWSISTAKSGAPAAPRPKPAISSTTFSKSAPRKSKPAATPIPRPSRWSCLKADFDDVFKVFVDLLRDPEFRADKLDLAQKAIFRRHLPPQR